MVRLGFNDGSGANAMERKGFATGMFLGKVVNSVDHAMNAFADPKNFMTHAMSAVKALVQKIEGKPTMAFANNDEGFNPTLSKAKQAFNQGFNRARAKAPEQKRQQKQTGPTLGLT